MSDTIATTRALLRMFEQSGYGDLHVRVGDYALFVARTGGRVNPLRVAVPEKPITVAATAAVLPKPAASSTISAPHIATMLSAIPVGSAILAGDHVARIVLLGEAIDLTAEHAGLVEAIIAQPGALLEYGAPIVTILSAQ
jgi:biotin carboxyl carrier protein